MKSKLHYILSAACVPALAFGNPVNDPSSGVTTPTRDPSTGQTTPGRTTPGQTTPGVTNPGQTTPGQTGATTPRNPATGVTTPRDPATVTTSPQRDGAQHKDALTKGKSAGPRKASEYLGMSVKNHQDETLGSVTDMWVDLESGRIAQVILTSGAAAGGSELVTPVPPSAFEHDAAQQGLRLNTNLEKLKAAPRSETAKGKEGASYSQLSESYRYFGKESDLNFVTRNGSQTGTEKEAAARSTDRTADTSADRTTIQSPDQSTDRTAGTSADRTTIQSPDQSANQPAGRTTLVAGTRRNMIPESRLSNLQPASEILGRTVTNHEDEEIGDVEDLVVDLQRGRIVAVVLASGEFLGVNEALNAVPPTALSFSEDRETLHLDASKEMLTEAPHFKSNAWPDFTTPAYTDSLYRAFEVEPYDRGSEVSERTSATGGLRTSATDTRRDGTTPGTENTEVNKRDRDGLTATPFDQGNSQGDIATTAQIRREIVAQDDLSSNAHNVKVVTKDGMVSLRGPVETAEEKRQIGEIANRIAGSTKVENQLEVKLTASN